jgi:amino acid adenylation domain-containing protein
MVLLPPTLSNAQRALLLKRLSEHVTGNKQTFCIERASREGPIPLSSSQQRLWFFHEFDPDGYAVTARPLAQLLTGPLNVQVLQRSLDEIVRRHEIFRTIYHDKDGEPLQRMLDPGQVMIVFEDLQHLPEGEREPEAIRIVIAESRKPFNLRKELPIRAHVLKLAQQRHLLLIVTHHIAFDGWSANVLTTELAALYSAFLEDRPSPLQELPIQYADYAVWQRKRLDDDAMQDHLAYWRKQLENLAPPAQFSMDWPKPDATPSGTARRTYYLPASLTAPLKTLGGEEATLFMTMLAAFQLLLARYTRQDDVTIGTLVSSRTHVDTEPLIGCFINTLVLRTDLSGNPSFRQLLGRVREVTLGALKHQELPFEKLSGVLPMTRSLGQSLPFRVLFQMRNMPRTTAIKAADLTIEQFSFDAGIGGQELSVEIVKNPDGIECVFEYALELFRPETIDRLAGHYQTLLQNIVADPDRDIGRLEYLTQQERQQLLVAWNDTSTDLGPVACVHELFSEQVARTPDAPALTATQGQLTYAELNARVNRLAHYLRRTGVGPEARIGLCMEPCLEMVIGLLGILKAGGAFVPLRPADPHERLAGILKDAGVSLLITQPALLAQFVGACSSLLCIDAEWETLSQESDAEPPAVAGLRQAAYVIYTSGSTGHPKGVMIEHRGIGNMVKAQIHAFGIRSDSRVLQYAPLSFDASVSEIFMALLAGATLVLPDSSTPLVGPALIEVLHAQAITAVTLPPVVLAQLPREDLPQLHTIIAAGDACPADLARRWQRGRRFFNAYGPTEATVCATLAEVSGDDWTSVIGRPLANTRVYVLDDHLQPVAVGVAGELYLGGPGLARGYLNRPELTAEKFIRNPFSDDPQERLYRTGDLVRYRPDAMLEFLGRIDDQVKIRGFRVEPGEIQTLLNQHPGVLDSAVVTQAFGADGVRLVAYVVETPDLRLTQTQLREFLERQLPEYMVPAAFQVLDALPLTSSGKLDRAALPAPDTNRPQLEQPFVAPRTPGEARLARIWSDLLGVERIGVYDNIFELGGDSLLFTRLASRVLDAFQVRLPIRVLFDLHTIDEMMLAILEYMVEGEEEDKMNQMIRNLDQLSSSEIRKLLEE